jgi:soluble cytochrome b562
MPTPTKPIAVIMSEGNRRRLSKKEIELRSKEEESLVTGIEMHEREEVQVNEIAHKEFVRLSKLLKNIGKNDDLTAHVINEHCLIYAECRELDDAKQIYINNLRMFEDRLIEENIPFSEEMKIRMGMQKQILDIDKALMAKRKMLLDIAKENIMTIASQLRSIPKKPNDEEKEDPMAKFLSKRG